MTFGSLWHGEDGEAGALPADPLTYSSVPETAPTPGEAMSGNTTATGAASPVERGVAGGEVPWVGLSEVPSAPVTDPGAGQQMEVVEPLAEEGAGNGQMSSTMELDDLDDLREGERPQDSEDHMDVDSEAPIDNLAGLGITLPGGDLSEGDSMDATSTGPLITAPAPVSHVDENMDMHGASPEDGMDATPTGPSIAAPASVFVDDMEHEHTSADAPMQEAPAVVTPASRLDNLPPASFAPVGPEDINVAPQRALSQSQGHGAKGKMPVRNEDGAAGSSGQQGAIDPLLRPETDMIGRFERIAAIIHGLQFDLEIWLEEEIQDFRKRDLHKDLQPMESHVATLRQFFVEDSARWLPQQEHAVLKVDPWFTDCSRLLRDIGRALTYKASHLPDREKGLLETFRRKLVPDQRPVTGQSQSKQKQPEAREPRERSLQEFCQEWRTRWNSSPHVLALTGILDDKNMPVINKRLTPFNDL